MKHSTAMLDLIGQSVILSGHLLEDNAMTLTPWRGTPCLVDIPEDSWDGRQVDSCIMELCH